ncbi:MAG: 2'-5' RNA ligase family protein [Opitutales bacterium]
MKTRHLSYWLIPTAEDSDVLQTVINELATRFEAASFPPHLTLFAGPAASDEEPRHLLDSLSPDLVPRRLAVTHVDASDRFTMTLFLRCQPDPQLVSLHEQIRANAPPSNYCLEPHLSLLYADLPLSAKQSLAEEFSPPLKEIRFDRIRAVSHLSLIRTHKDIEDFHDLWEMKYHQS